METITITFGDVCENHVGNQQLGTIRDSGFTISEINKIKTRFEKKGYECELFDLTELVEESVEDLTAVDHASILVVRNGVEHFTQKDLLFGELKSLEWDKKAKMRGRVVNKRARYNLCFADNNQEANYEDGKGTVVAFNELEHLNKVRSKLPKIFKEKAENLFAEGNYYYDINKTYIGFHGDAERRIVIALRLGASFPLSYQWYHRSQTVGERLDISLDDGDLYVMSEKAVGNDWKKSSRYTLRHGAGLKI